MQTNFCVGYSGDFGDLKQILAASPKVKTVYSGGLARKIGGARPSFLESWAQLAPQVAYAHKHGAKFNIALNASTGVPNKSDKVWWQDITAYLQEIENQGVDGVIVAHPMLMRQVKTHTHLKLTVSTVCEVMTARAALYYEDMGADVIVPSMNANLNMNQLRLMRKSLKRTKLRIMLNERCLGDCIFRKFHFDEYSGLSGNQKNRGDQYYLNCHTTYFREPHLLLANNTIRPEDIRRYKEITDDFKIVGRMATIEDQLARIRAYDQESFDGNYIQLIISQFKSLIDIPNKALDGLIEKKWACDKICERCGHCQQLFEEYGQVNH